MLKLEFRKRCFRIQCDIVLRVLTSDSIFKWIIINSKIIKHVYNSI